MHASSTAAGSKQTNRLINETSPYLLQHAHNPVDWHAWGPEAFERARRENKPIFLSVGYSTCYWCHVMERQSFENPAVAEEMNQRFVNIKVDREERPDVDQLYMTAVQVLTRHGGWPMSVWLTPDLRPFYGGTYFPPTDSYGRPGFVTVLKAIEGAYRDRPDDVEKTASQLVDILRQLAEPRPPAEAMRVDERMIEEWIARSTSDYERRHGGFGNAPKFPRETLLELLLVYLDSRQQAKGGGERGEIASMLRHALDAMAAGGIRDHLGGGFHRYSTDAQWLVPHFEIMLYDNAMLGWIYAQASRVFGHGEYANVARGIFDFTLREMTAPSGGFYTAFDAEVDAQEGLSYLWTAEEIERVLGKDDAKLFGQVYGVDRGPNFADPHHGTGKPDKNILFLSRTIRDVANEMGSTPEALEARLEPLRERLYQHRLTRKQPLLDTKIITSWNALMIRAMARAGRVLEEERYIRAASAAADYLIKEHLRADGTLWRTGRDGKMKYDAFLDDYAFLAQALLELSLSAGQEHRRDQAEQVARRMNELFADDERGGYYFTGEGADDLIVRQKVGSDSPLPSGAGVAAMVMLELGETARAGATIRAFAGQLDAQAEGMGALVQAALGYARKQGPLEVEAGKVQPERPISPEQMAAAIVALGAQWASPVELRVTLRIAEGFHIHSHDAAKGMVATQLTVGGEGARIVEAIDYPPGEQRKLAFEPAPLSVYEGTVALAVKFREPPRSGENLRMALSYQACDEQACLPPITKQFEVAATAAS